MPAYFSSDLGSWAFCVSFFLMAPRMVENTFSKFIGSESIPSDVSFLQMFDSMCHYIPEFGNILLYFP